MSRIEMSNVINVAHRMSNVTRVMARRCHVPFYLNDIADSMRNMTYSMSHVCAAEAAEVYTLVTFAILSERRCSFYVEYDLFYESCLRGRGR